MVVAPMPASDSQQEFKPIAVRQSLTFELAGFVSSGWRGNLRLLVREQVITFDLSSSTTGKSFEVRIADSIPHPFIATSLDQADETTLLLGGFDPECGGGRIALVPVDIPGEKLGVNPVEWGGAGLRSVTDLSMYPSRDHAVLLDTAGQALFLCNMRTGRIHKVASSDDYPALKVTKHLQINRQPKPSVGVMVLATEDHPSSSVGTFSGVSVSLFDRDADGIFEEIR